MNQMDHTEPQEAVTPEKPALYWDKGDDDRVICLLCPNQCKIAEGKTGICRVRRNKKGQLIASAYGKITSIALDPIEKKPLYAFYPGSRILSVGSFGCNLRCLFCQNWLISQKEAEWQLIMPDELVALAIRERRYGNIGLAYTYNEPLINYEYVLDCSKLARENDLKNVLVTNGYINPDPLKELLPFIDAMNIDLKGWQPSFYREYCRGERDPVLETIKLSAQHCHVEVTTLLLPSINDDENEIEAIASFIASVDPSIILHLTRHHPAYLMSEPKPISRERMEKLAQVAKRHLKTVVLGNV